MFAKLFICFVKYQRRLMKAIIISRLISLNQNRKENQAKFSFVVVLVDAREEGTITHAGISNEKSLFRICTITVLGRAIPLHAQKWKRVEQAQLVPGRPSDNHFQKHQVLYHVKYSQSAAQSLCLMCFVLVPSQTRKMKTPSGSDKEYNLLCNFSGKHGNKLKL